MSGPPRNRGQTERFAVLCLGVEVLLEMHPKLAKPLTGRDIARILNCGMRRAQRALRAVRSAGRTAG